MTGLNWDDLGTNKITQLKSEAKRLGLSTPKSPQKSELIRILGEYKNSSNSTPKPESKSSKPEGSRVYSTTPSLASKESANDDSRGRKVVSAATTPKQEEPSPIVSSFTFKRMADASFFNARSIIILFIVFILFGLYIINSHNDIGTTCILSGIAGLIYLLCCNTHRVVDFKTR